MSLASVLCKDSVSGFSSFQESAWDRSANSWHKSWKAITSMGKRFEAWCESRRLVPTSVLPVQCGSLAAFLVDRCDQLQGSSKALGSAVSMIKNYSGRSCHPWLDWQKLIVINKIIKTPSISRQDICTSRDCADLGHPQESLSISSVTRANQSHDDVRSWWIVPCWRIVFIVRGLGLCLVSQG